MIRIQHIFRCDHCHVEQLEEYSDIPLNGNLPSAIPPRDWSVVDGYLYCPRHEVKINIVINDSKIPLKSEVNLA